MHFSNTSALTDGLLVTRYSGEALIFNAFGPTATRSTVTEVDTSTSLQKAA